MSRGGDTLLYLIGSIWSLSVFYVTRNIYFLYTKPASFFMGKSISVPHEIMATALITGLFVILLSARSGAEG